MRCGIQPVLTTFLSFSVSQCGCFHDVAEPIFTKQVFAGKLFVRNAMPKFIRTDKILVANTR